MATHSSVLAWRIPGPNGLRSVGSHRVGHDWSNLAAAAAAMCFNKSCCCRWIPWLLRAKEARVEAGIPSGDYWNSLGQGFGPDESMQRDPVMTGGRERVLCHTRHVVMSSNCYWIRRLFYFQSVSKAFWKHWENTNMPSTPLTFGNLLLLNPKWQASDSRTPAFYV